MSSSDDEESPTKLLEKHKKFKSERDEVRAEADLSRWITLKDFGATCHAARDASAFEDLVGEPKSIFADFCPPSVGQGYSIGYNGRTTVLNSICVLDTKSFEKGHQLLL